MLTAAFLLPLIPLDLATFMAMESFVAVLAGLALFFGWWQSREATALLPWAAGNVLVSFGIYDFYMGASTGNPVWFALGTFSVSLAGGLIWAAARMFSGRRVSIPVVAAGAVLSIAVGALAGAGLLPQSVPALLPLVTGSAYFAAAALTLWQGRDERLATRAPIILLLAIHAGVLAVGAIETIAGNGQPNDLVAPLGTVFGVIHFESIIFNVGTTVFFLAMTRERKELFNRRAAHTDGLTGIANRQSFMEALERVLRRCRRNRERLAVVMFDLDRFKAINDGHGHGTGDEVIRQFVRVARDALRPTDLFGRVGGEEFAMALPGADLDIAFARADRIRIEFSRVAFQSERGDPFAATVSAGVAAEDGRPLAELLAAADSALYRAKAEGRNRVVRATGPGKGAVLRVA